MSQTSVRDQEFRAFEGMVHDRPDREASALADGIIYFGKGVTTHPTTGIADEPLQVRMYTSGEIFAGVAAADVTVERTASAAGIPNQAPYGAFIDETSVRLIRRGRVWVKTADAVDDLSKSVFVRNATPGGSPPAESLGSFRATTAVGYIDLGAIAAVSWLRGTTIDGDNYGLLEINLP